MKTTCLGKSDLNVSMLGLGCVGMSEGYGLPDETSAFATLARAVDLGINFIDTADAYGIGHNEELIGKAYKNMRHKVLLATKFGIIRKHYGDRWNKVCAHPDYVKSACEASLKRLQTDVIDLYYLHRMDPTVPIEDTVGAMATLVTEGKVRYIGLSEVDTTQLRRAHQIHPITALQTEYSLWSREPEEGIFAACQELGISFVAYSPIARGLLSGMIKTLDMLPTHDGRRQMARFSTTNFPKNLALIAKLQDLAAQHNCTAAQLSLAWMLNKNPGIIPIPGTKRVSYLEENAASVHITLTADQCRQLEKAFPKHEIAGAR